MEISVQARPRDATSWAELARRCQDVGVRALLVSDHPGIGPSPWVALAAAAGVTTTVRLGSCVVNAGVRDPLLLAQDVATLDVVSGGRAELGIGAGHTPAEWEMTGTRRPPVTERIDRLVSVASRARALLDGEAVTGEFGDIVLTEPRPVQTRVPLLVGGGNPRLLRWAGEHADAVGISGLGRTLEDGHSHAVRWSVADVDATVAHAGGTKPLEALVQHVAVTDDADRELARFAESTQTSADDLVETPYVWVGTSAEIARKITACEQRWGITRWVVREPALDAVAGLLAQVQ